MVTAQDITDSRRALLQDLFQALNNAGRPFSVALDEFLARLFEDRLPCDWRDRWHAFVAEQQAAGFEIDSLSARELEAWIERWARYCRLEPLPRDAADPRADAGHSTVMSGRRAPSKAARKKKSRRRKRSPRYQTNTKVEFFRSKLKRAQHHVDEIKRLLESLGHQLDRAAVDEPVEVETVADAIDALIFQYNDALESAGDAWLRHDLSRDIFAEINRIPTLGSLGLPRFTDAQQQQRAASQGLRINDRHHAHDARMDRAVFAAKSVDTAVTVTSIALGGGLVAVAVKQGGKMAIVKLAVATAVETAAEAGVETALRAAGADEQVISGFKLAAQVVRLALLHRQSVIRPSAKPPKTKTRTKDKQGQKAGDESTDTNDTSSTTKGNQPDAKSEPDKTPNRQDAPPKGDQPGEPKQERATVAKRLDGAGTSPVPGPNPNNLRQRAVTSPTAGEGGVYLKPQGRRTKIGSTSDYRGQYGPNAPNGIEVEIPLTRTGPAADDSAYRWTARRQARFDEEHLDRITPSDVRYRAPGNPRSPVEQSKWEKFRHIFGYGDLPPDFGL